MLCILFWSFEYLANTHGRLSSKCELSVGYVWFVTNPGIRPQQFKSKTLPADGKWNNNIIHARRLDHPFLLSFKNFLAM